MATTEPLNRPVHRVAKELIASSGFLLARLGFGFKGKAISWWRRRAASFTTTACWRSSPKARARPGDDRRGAGPRSQPPRRAPRRARRAGADRPSARPARPAPPRRQHHAGRQAGAGAPPRTDPGARGRVLRTARCRGAQAPPRAARPPRAGARPGLRVPGDEAGLSRLLVRDLAQLATPAGTEAPLRGAALGEVDVVEDAYVLCEDGRIAAAGRMARPRPARRRRRGARRARPLRGPRPRRLPHACLLRGRPRRGVRAAAPPAPSYEELHAAGGGILSTVRATRAAGEERADRRRRAARGMDARRGHDDLRGEVGLRAGPRHGARAAAGREGRPAGSRPGSAHTPSRPSSTTPTRTSTSPSPRFSPRRRRSPRPPTCFSSAAPSTPSRRAAT